MTIGAALATIVIVALIILGPMATVCSSSGDGFFSCIHDRLATNGLLPRPLGAQPSEIATASAAGPASGVSAMVTSPAANPPAPVATQSAATGAPAPAATAPAAPVSMAAAAPTPTVQPAATAAAPTVAPAAPVAPAPKSASKPPAPSPAAPSPSSAANDPTFGLVRAEPDGSLVIAGSAKPGETVEVYADDKLLGEAKTEQSGDWVLVPDQPIAAGGVELTLGVKGVSGRAQQSYVVAIDPGKKSEPLVVASTPGKMDTVLQGLAKPMQEPAQPAAEGNVAPPAQVAATTAAPASPPAETAAAPQVSALSSKPLVVASASPPAAAPPIAASVTSAPVSASSVPATAEKGNAVATAGAISPAPAATAGDIAPDIDAIEIDGDKNFFAGSGPNRATVRLYVSDKFIADAIVAGGRWLIETGKVLVLHSQTVRIDVLKAGSSAVTARAEVNFVIDLPQLATAAPSTVVASNTAPVQPKTKAATPPVASLADAGSQRASAPQTPTASPSTNVASVAPAVATPSQADDPASQPKSSDTAQSSAAAVPAAGSVIRATSATPAAVAAPEKPAISPVPAAAPQTVAAAQPPAPAAPATAPAMPTIVAEPVGGVNSGRFASGRAIIRHGDNLWTIAQRVYGSGVHYTTIFQANANQIRNPHWIYPGQVFSLPIGGGK